jgi:hypothetical protein
MWCHFYDTLNVYAWPTSINNNTKNKKQFSIYPNPAKDELMVSIFDDAMGDVAVYNIYGSKLISQKAINNSLKINVSGLAKGVYLIKYNGGLQRFIKE